MTLHLQDLMWPFSFLLLYLLGSNWYPYFDTCLFILPFKRSSWDPGLLEKECLLLWVFLNLSIFWRKAAGTCLYPCLLIWLSSRINDSTTVLSSSSSCLAIKYCRISSNALLSFALYLSSELSWGEGSYHSSDLKVGYLWAMSFSGVGLKYYWISLESSIEPNLISSVWSECPILMIWSTNNIS